jgi:hypothetical protein
MLLVFLTGCSMGPELTKAPDKVTYSDTTLVIDGAKVVASGSVGGMYIDTVEARDAATGALKKTLVVRFKEGDASVTKGGWTFSWIFKLSIWWIPILIVLGILCYFFFPIIFKGALMAAEGLGKAFSPTTFKEVVRSIEKGRQTIKTKYGEGVLEDFDQELSKEMDTKLKTKISKAKLNMKKEKKL